MSLLRNQRLIEDVTSITAGLIAIIAVAWLILWHSPAHGHESWINKGAYKNRQGEWCCGDYDCKSYTQIQSTNKSWIINGEEIPFDEALPVAPPDGSVTVCRRPDGSRRCVFGVMPGG